MQGLLFFSHILEVLDRIGQRFAIYIIFDIIEADLNFFLVINFLGSKLDHLFGIESADFIYDFFTFRL